MADITDGLNIRFKTALESKTEREFYMSLFHYFDYIYKTPKLKKIFDNSEEKYHSAFSEIWKERRKDYTQKELDEKSAQVYKLERFNLYAVGCYIEGRIYWPIDDYKNNNEPDEKQDLKAVILVKGSDYATKLKCWDKESIRIYKRWYEGNRNEYEVELRRFHIMFLDELNKQSEIIPEQKNTNFSLNAETGQFKYLNTEGILSPTSREFKFLKVLYTSPEYQATYKDLCNNPDKVLSYHKNMMTETIKVLKRKLKITPKKKGSNPDIIKNISKYGYKLDI